MHSWSGGFYTTAPNDPIKPADLENSKRTVSKSGEQHTNVKTELKDKDHK